MAANFPSLADRSGVIAYWLKIDRKQKNVIPRLVDEAEDKIASLIANDSLTAESARATVIVDASLSGDCARIKAVLWLLQHYHGMSYSSIYDTAVSGRVRSTAKLS